MRIERAFPRFLATCAVSALMALPLGCSGSSSQAKSPDDTALLAQPNENVAAPSSSEVQKGIDALQAQDFQKAKTILAEATKKSPQDPQAAFYYGAALEGAGERDAAIESYQKALSLEPTLTEASQNLSAALVDKGDFAGALQAADAGLKQHPEDPVLLANRAIALESAGSPETLSAYEKAVAKAPNNGQLRYSYATALAKAGKRDESIAELKKIPTDDAAFASAVADTFGKLSAYDDCIRVIDAAVAKAPNPELFVRRAMCKHGKKDDAGMQADLQQAVKLDDNFAPAHFYLGKQLAAAGKTADARAELEKAAKTGAGTPIADAAQKALTELDSKAPKKPASPKK